MSAHRSNAIRKYASESVGVRVLDERDRTALQALPSGGFKSAARRLRGAGIQA
jgi:hypothetical protein